MSLFANRQIGGTVVKSTTPPNNTNLQWVDMSSGKPITKIYDENLKEWVVTSGGSGLETVEVLPTNPQDGQAVIHRVDGVSTIKVYDGTLDDWTIPAGGGGESLGYTPINKAGDTVTGNLILKDGVSIIPENPDGATLGSPEKCFADIFIGANSLYVDGNKVISSTETTLDVTTTADQHLAVSTSGLGTTRLASNKEVILYSDDDINLQAKGDITTLSKGRVTFKTDLDGEDIVFETQGTLSNVNFKSKRSINFASPETTFTSKPKVNGVNVITESDVDNTTIQIINNKLVVKNIEGLTIGVVDINNWLSGTSSNLQTQINSVNSTITTLASGMEYRGKVNSFADLSNITFPTNGTLVVVLTDETQSNGRSMYVYSEDLVSWEFIGSFTFSDKFIELTDTPSSYLGNNGKVVKVDETNNQVVFSYVNWNEIQNKPTSTVTDIDDAVSKKHTHSNKALIDSYTQTESDLADSVSKKHEHPNLNVLNKFSEDVDGKPLYNGSSIGSGGIGAGGGHVISNEGNNLPQRAKLDFQNMIVTDDVTSDATIIKPFTASGGKVVFENVSGTVATISQNEEISISHSEVENGKISIEIWEKIDGTIASNENVDLSSTIHEDSIIGTNFANNLISLKNTNNTKLVSLFKFDEVSGNVTDSKGTAIGVISGATRVLGYSGNALSFDGVDDYIDFNQNVIPLGKKSIRFRIKKNGMESRIENIISNANSTVDNGLTIFFTASNFLYLQMSKGVSGTPNFAFGANFTPYADNQWHDILFTWDGTTNSNAVKLYIDNMNTPIATGTANATETTTQSRPLRLGRSYNTVSTGFYSLKAELDELEIYNDVINPNYYDTSKSYYIANKIKIADLQKINLFTVNGAEPTNTSRKFLISFDGKSLTDVTKQYLYSTDGVTKLIATNGLEDLQTVGMNKTQLETLLANYNIVNEEILDIVADLATSDTSISPTISGYVLNVDKKSTYKEVSDDSIYEIRQVSPKLSTVKRLVAGSKNILINVLSESKNSENGNGGHVIQDNGVDLSQRDKLNFKGFTITDDSANNTTTIEVNASNKASDITVEDTNGYFSSTTVEGALAELFQLSDSVINDGYIGTIGNPLDVNDTNENNILKLQQIKLKMATNLNNKDVPTLPSDSLDKMADDIALIPNVSLTGVKKLTKLNIASPYQHQIVLNQPLKLEDIATSVLKYVQGESDIVQYNAEYNNGEASNFTYNPNEVVFDGFMNIKDSWDYPLTTVSTDYFETSDIDFSQFVSYGGNATVNVDGLNVNIKALKTNSIIVKASGDISINGVESLDKINWLNAFGGNGISNLVVSFDGGITWKSYKNGQWITVDINNKSDFKTNGMDKSTVDALTNTELSIARDGSNFIRFAYYLERPTYTDMAKNDKIQLIVTMQGYNEIANNDVFDYSYDPLTKTLTYYFYQDATFTINYIDMI